MDSLIKGMIIGFGLFQLLTVLLILLLPNEIKPLSMLIALGIIGIPCCIRIKQLDKMILNEFNNKK